MLRDITAHKSGCSPNDSVVAVDYGSQGSVFNGEAVADDDASPATESGTFILKSAALILTQNHPKQEAWCPVQKQQHFTQHLKGR